MQAPSEIGSAINEHVVIILNNHQAKIFDFHHVFAVRDVYKLTNFCIDFDLISNGTDGLLKQTLRKKPHHQP